MTTQQFGGFWRLLHRLNEADLLPYVQVIGSWAEYLYAFSGVLPGFQASLRTLDVDFLVSNQRLPRQKKNFMQFAKEAGYLLSEDTLTGATKLFTQDVLEVEFLIAQKGSGENPVLPTNIGVNAQALSHLDILRDHPLALDLPDFSVIVPMPEAYVLHKCVIHSARAGKQQKDREALLALLPHINREKVCQVFLSLSKRQKKEAIRTLNSLEGEAS